MEVTVEVAYGATTKVEDAKEMTLVVVLDNVAVLYVGTWTDG